jgi:hypothetical protein
MKRKTILLSGIAVGVVVVLVSIGLLRHTKVDIGHSVRYWGLNRISVLLWIKPDFVISTDEYGNTPLHFAANGCEDKLALLLAKGANINARNKHGRTPLYGAVLANRNDEVEWLLAHGAEVSVKDDIGVTPLHLAVSQGCKDTVGTLLTYGASVNAEDNQGGTPLYWATKRIKEMERTFKMNNDERMVLSNALYAADSPTNKLGFSKQTAEAVQSLRVAPYFAEQQKVVELLRMRGGYK